MKTKNEKFEVLIPNADGTAVSERVVVSVPVEWDEELKEWLLTAEAHQMIEDTKARHMGLLLPGQLKELRERYGYTQREMGELFQAGDKSWTRWESGKHRPSRVINLLICALYEGEISINYLLKRAGKPLREVEVEANPERFSRVALCSITTGMHYTVVDETSEQMLLIQSKGHGKSGMLKAILHKMALQPSAPIALVPPGTPDVVELVPDRCQKRFDYEKVNLVRPYPCVA